MGGLARTWAVCSGASLGEGIRMVRSGRGVVRAHPPDSRRAGPGIGPSFFLAPMLALELVSGPRANLGERCREGDSHRSQSAPVRPQAPAAALCNAFALAGGARPLRAVLRQSAKRRRRGYRRRSRRSPAPQGAHTGPDRSIMCAYIRGWRTGADSAANLGRIWCIRCQLWSIQRWAISLAQRPVGIPGPYYLFSRRLRLGS